MDNSSQPELTVRGVALGVAITLVFTAANVYLGLKVGLTFASSIPAAVISMGVLSFFRHSNIRENNIVQTLASGAGAMASVIFVLPGLVIVGWWTGFPFFISFLICAAGGVLGVLFTIPLRRTLVTNSDLPYPEGIASAEVLKVGSSVREKPDRSVTAHDGLLAIIVGTLTSAGLAALGATRIAAGELQNFIRLGPASATGYDISYSLALIAAGHLVGLSVGMAMLAGLLIAWAGAVPILTAIHPDASATLGAHVMHIWTAQVRFLGAGAMAIAALWTLGRMAHPLVVGFVRTVAAARTAMAASVDQTDRDLSGPVILGLTLACFVVITATVWAFLSASPLAGSALPLTLVALPFALIVGFFVAAICGYMAGLIGSSNSPVSGVGILSVVICASLYVLVAPPTPATAPALVAFALFTTAIVFGVAVTSNDNLQDLKTGQLVGAAPWRQQIALIIGIIAGSAMVPPVLNLLAHAYGFAGTPGLPVTAHPLPAPQANLISTLALGVVGHKLDWNMIGIGVLVGFAAVAVDAILGRAGKMRLPPLAIGMGIYLPMSATLPVAIGAVIGWWYNRRAERTSDPAHTRYLGVLTASGMIVGESLFGVLLAGLIVALSNDAPLALVPEDFAYAPWFGLIAFTGMLVVLYGWMLRRGNAAPRA